MLSRRITWINQAIGTLKQQRDQRVLKVPKEQERKLDNTDSWYCVLTKPHEEKLASAHLIRQDFEIFLPFIKSKRLYRRKLQWITSPMFPPFQEPRFTFSLESCCPSLAQTNKRMTGETSPSRWRNMESNSGAKFTKEFPMQREYFLTEVILGPEVARK